MYCQYLWCVVVVLVVQVEQYIDVGVVDVCGNMVVWLFVYFVQYVGCCLEVDVDVVVVIVVECEQMQVQLIGEGQLFEQGYCQQFGWMCVEVIGEEVDVEFFVVLYGCWGQGGQICFDCCCVLLCIGQLFGGVGIFIEEGEWFDYCLVLCYGLMDQC